MRFSISIFSKRFFSISISILLFRRLVFFIKISKVTFMAWTVSWSIYASSTRLLFLDLSGLVTSPKLPVHILHLHIAFFMWKPRKSISLNLPWKLFLHAVHFMTHFLSSKTVLQVKQTKFGLLITFAIQNYNWIFVNYLQIFNFGTSICLCVYLSTE